MITPLDSEKMFNVTSLLNCHLELIDPANLSYLTKHCLESERNETKQSILKDLLSHNYDEEKYKCQLEHNTKIIKDMFYIVQQLPTINEITANKPTIPTFEPIPVQKTDSAEIKKFIRKINFEMVGFHCNHQMIDEKCDKVIKHITDLYDTDEFRHYQSFHNKVVEAIMKILEMNKFSPQKEFYEMCHMLDSNELRSIVDDIIRLNGMVSNYNATTNKRCNKCEAAVRKYNYCLEEIQRMRDELRIQNELDEEYVNKPAEKEYDMEEFLQKNYPTLGRFPLSDVKKKYFATFKINLTHEELTEKIEKTGKFKITNVHRTLYVNRL